MVKEKEQTQRETPHIPAERVEETFERAGEGLGAFTIQTSQRLQSLFTQGVHTAQSVANRSAQAASAPPPSHDGDQPGGDATAGPQTAQRAQATQDAQAETGNAPVAEKRAEELVDATGRRLSEWGRAASLRAQMLWARIKEEGEDILAEAQEVRQPPTTQP